LNLSSVLNKYRLRNLRDPLFQNSFYLMSTSISSAVFGFIFWALVARLYMKEEIGLAVGLISLLSLMLLISRLGVDQSMIRFLPKGNRSGIFWTSVFITTSIAVLVAIVAILVISQFIPALRIAENNSLEFIGILGVASIVGISGQAFIALRKSKLYLLQNLMMQSRIIFIFLLVSMGSFGIFGSYGLSFVVALIFSMMILPKFGIKFSSFDRQFLKKTFSFSLDNFIVSILLTIPSMLLPIMVLGTLGPASAANYYIAFTFVQIVFIIPSSFSISLFVEGSHGEPLGKIVRSALLSIFILLTFLVAMIILFGGFVLGLIGGSYLESLPLLYMLAISSFAMVAHSIYFSIKRIQKKTRILILLSAISFSLLLILGQLFMIAFGLDGLGFAWLINFSIMTLIVIILAKREGLFMKSRNANIP